MELDRRPGIDRLPGRRSIDAASPAGRLQRIVVMKIIATFCLAAALVFSGSSAEAKGCLKGAVVGGVAGHYAGHHGMLGAAAGCLYGRHRAKEQERQQPAPEHQSSALPPRDDAKGGGM
jgi:hypothetical protein